MTIEQVIDIVDTLKPNTYDDNIKIAWLSDLDGRIWKDVFMKHFPLPRWKFKPYTGNTEQTKELLVPYPYAHNLYVNYLSACIDKQNEEMDKYNVSVSFYNSAYMDFTSAYNREHKPIPSGRFRF